MNSGSFALKGRIPGKDAVTTTQLKNAGAIVMGKINMSVSDSSLGDSFVTRALTTIRTGMGKQ